MNAAATATGAASDPSARLLVRPATLLPRSAPLAANLVAREGRDAYLAENGFTVEGYDAPRTEASFLGVAFSVPNPPLHRRGLMLHDLHHVVTGFGTDLGGEAEVSAWELRGGLSGLGVYTGSLVVAGALAGLLFAPLRTLRAFRASSGRSLFASRLSYDALLALPVGDLRRSLAIPEAGLAAHPRALHSRAPSS